MRSSMSIILCSRLSTRMLCTSRSTTTTTTTTTTMPSCLCPSLCPSLPTNMLPTEETLSTETFQSLDGYSRYQPSLVTFAIMSLLISDYLHSQTIFVQFCMNAVFAVDDVAVA